MANSILDFTYPRYLWLLSGETILIQLSGLFVCPGNRQIGVRQIHLLRRLKNRQTIKTELRSIATQICRGNLRRTEDRLMPICHNQTRIYRRHPVYRSHRTILRLQVPGQKEAGLEMISRDLRSLWCQVLNLRGRHQMILLVRESKSIGADPEKDLETLNRQWSLHRGHHLQMILLVRRSESKEADPEKGSQRCLTIGRQDFHLKEI